MTENHKGHDPATALGRSAAAEPMIPPDIDFSVPSIARTYDYMLGGKDNLAVDRAVGDQLFEIAPDATSAAQENRKILNRAVRYLGEQGIRQFVDLGSGLPTQDNVHQVAQRHFPDSRVVYVDNDPIVLAHGRALLSNDDQTAVITCDIRDYEQIMDNPATRRLINLDEPVGILLCGILHHFEDDEETHSIVERFRDTVVPGSYVFITHFCSDTEDAAASEEILMRDLGSGRYRSREEIEGFFSGWDLVTPGVTYLPLWHPEEPVERELTELEKFMAGGVGRKP